MLRVEGLHCQAGGRPVIRGISAEFEAGRLHVIVGPNGSGKSTLVKAISGEWPVTAGAVYYDGVKVSGADKTGFAKRRAVMSQLPELHFPVRVDDIVMMGRYPHFSWRPGHHDADICRQAMERLSVSSLADRDYLSLSGGERQRVQFARALAQIWDPPESGSRYLFLDEPVSSLDIHFQHEFLGLARSLAGAGTVLIAVLHDLNLALEYADRILFLKEGRVAAVGTAPEIVTPALIREVFGMNAHLLPNPFGSRPVVVYETGEIPQANG
jgi:iron complex transport system ATP-binding protein